MTATTMWYSTDSYGDESRFEVGLPRAYDLDDRLDQRGLAIRCAENFHSEHGGWECSWPLVFKVYESEDGPEIARFSVDRDVAPLFTAIRLPTQSAQQVTP